MNTNKRKLKVGEASCFVGLLALVALLSSCGPGIEPNDKLIWIPGKLTFGTSTPGGTIQIGDPYKVTLRAIYPTNGVVDFPEIGREKDIVVLDRKWNDQLFSDGHKKTELILTITSFRIGDHVICTEPAIYHHDGISETNRCPETKLTVITSLEADATSKIADIKPVHKLPGRVPPWLWISLLVALIAFLVGLASSRLWKNRAVIIPRTPPIPPHVLAFQALQVLKGKGLLEKDECNPFYTELSLILRTYLEGRFLLNAPDETTEEIVGAMSRSPELGGSQRNILQDFMRQADMVKFAKGHPDRATMESAFDITKQFVEETKQDQTDRSNTSYPTDL